LRKKIEGMHDDVSNFIPKLLDKGKKKISPKNRMTPIGEQQPTLLANYLVLRRRKEGLESYRALIEWVTN